MSAKTWITLAIVAALAIGGWFLWHWWQAYQAQGGGNLGLGTNLNSVAPELVGGSAGPQVQPAVSLPVNITLSESVASAQPPATTMEGISAAPDNPLTSGAVTGNGNMGTMSEDTSMDVPLMKQAKPRVTERKTDHRKERRTDRKDR